MAADTAPAVVVSAQVEEVGRPVSAQEGAEMAEVAAGRQADSTLSVAVF